MILAPGLFFPVSSDIAIFLKGGEALLEGNRLYSDYIDLKPPLIYEIYAIIKFITGGGEFTIRLFDFFYQMLTAYLLTILTEKYIKDKTAAFFSGVMYSFSYVTLGFTQTLQGESFTVLWAVLLIMLVMQEDKGVLKLLSIGALCGMFFMIKFTLGIVLAAVLIYEFFQPSRRHFIIDLPIIIAGFFGIVLISFIPVFNPDSFGGFILMLDYLAFYSGMPPVNAIFVKTMIDKTGGFFGDKYSLLLTFMASLGAYLGFSKKQRDKKYDFIILNILLSGLLFLSIVVEKKFGEYHFTRMFIPLAILGGYGFSKVYRNILKDFLKRRIDQKIVIILLIIFAIFFSPIPRWVNLLQIPASMLKSEETYDNHFERNRSYDYMRVQHKKAASVINENINQNEKVMVIATGANAVNYFLKTKNISKFAQSQFYFGRHKVKKWEKDFYDELKKSHWLVVTDNDRHPAILGHSHSSLEMLNNNETASSYVNKNFEEFYKTKNLVIFLRKN